MGTLFSQSAYAIRVTSSPQGCLFMDIVDENDDGETLTEHRLRTEYWGYRFEAECVVDAPTTSSKRSELDGRQGRGVTLDEEYCSVVSFRVGCFNVILGAEIDAISPQDATGKKQQDRYVELKTCRMLYNERDRFNFERHRLSKWWVQSYLAGVNTVIVGFRVRQTRSLLCLRCAGTYCLLVVVAW